MSTRAITEVAPTTAVIPPVPTTDPIKTTLAPIPTVIPTAVPIVTTPIGPIVTTPAVLSTVPIQTILPTLQPRPTNPSGTVVVTDFAPGPTGISSNSSNASQANLSGGVLAAIIIGSIFGVIILIIVTLKNRRKTKDEFPPFFPSSTHISPQLTATHPSQHGSSQYGYSSNSLPMATGGIATSAAIAGFVEDHDSTASYYLTDGNGTATAFTAGGTALYTVPYDNEGQGQEQEQMQGQGQEYYQDEQHNAQREHSYDGNHAQTHGY